MLMKTKDVAKLTGFSVSKLNKMRVDGDGPYFVKNGASVRYLENDVMSWVHSLRRRSTSAVSPPEDA